MASRSAYYVLPEATIIGKNDGINEKTGKDWFQVRVLFYGGNNAFYVDEDGYNKMPAVGTECELEGVLEMRKSGFALGPITAIRAAGGTARVTGSAPGGSPGGRAQ